MIELKRYSDFLIRATIKIDGVPIDSSLFTFACKLRELADTPVYVPGGAMSLSVQTVAGDPTSVDLSLTEIQTATLAATTTAKITEMPILDIRLTTISSGRDDYTDFFRVNILETAAHD